MEVTISKSNYTFVDVSSWLDNVGRTYEDYDKSMWHFVLTLAAGVDQFGKNDRDKIEELYDLAAQQTGLRVGSLKTYVSAAHSPKALLALKHELTFQHARAVLGLADDVADAMLSQAKAQGWSPEDLGHEAWAKKNGLPSQRTLTGNTPPPSANGIAPQPGRTMTPPSAYAPRTDYRATDDRSTDDRAEYLAESPDAYDDTDEPPFTDPHSLLYDDPNTHDGYVWGAHNECWRNADAGSIVGDLWPDERILSMAQAAAIEATDADGVTWHAVLVDDVCRLLRTMRDEYEVAG